MSDCGCLVDPQTTERKGRHLNDAVEPPEPFLPSVSELVSGTFKKSLRYKSLGVPASTYLMTEEKRDCWMPDGKLGFCGPARFCYPKDKLEQREPSSNSICRYLNSYGKEVTINIVTFNLKLSVSNKTSQLKKEK